MLNKVCAKIPLIFFLIVIFIVMDLAIKERAYKRKIPQSTVEVLKSVAQTNANDRFGEVYLADFKVRQFNEQGKIIKFIKVKYGWKGKDKYFYMKEFVLIEFEYILNSDKIKCLTSVGDLIQCNTETGDISIIGGYKKRTNYVEKEIIFNYLEKE